MIEVGDKVRVVRSVWDDSRGKDWLGWEGVVKIAKEEGVYPIFVFFPKARGRYRHYDFSREELERLREERDEWERKAPVWTAQAVEPWQRRAEVTEVENQRLTEGLREISRIAVNGDDHAIPDPLARLDAIESVARALLSANPPQGDAAAGSSPSDGGGA